MLVVSAVLVGAPAEASAEEGPDLPVEAFDPPAGGADGASRAVVTPIVFPVEGAVQFDDGFGRCREFDCSRRHAGYDLIADRLQRLFATTAGQIVHVQNEPVNNAGNYLVLEGDDGFEYWYLHVNNDTPDTDDGLNPPEWRFAPGIDVGVRVEAGDFIGYVGDSGNAENTKPHLHVEMRAPAGPPDGLADFDAPPIDAAPSLFDAFARRESLPNPPPPNSAIHGDFDGDGDTDIVDYAAGPATDRLWSTTGSGVLVQTPLSILGTYWPLVADFDADRVDDIFWYAPGPARDYIWLGDAAGFRSLAVSVLGTYEPLVADFDADGGADILWSATGSGVDSLWTGFRDDERFESSRKTLPEAVPILGDFDGDRRSDVFWYAAGSAPDEIWFGGTSFSRMPVRVQGTYQPIAADFDGSGGDDVFWYRPGVGQDHLWTFTGRTFRSEPRSVLGFYDPQTADVDGDGRSDILWISAGGRDYVWTAGPDFASAEVSIDRPDPPRSGRFGGGPGEDLIWWRQPRAFVMDAPFGLLESSLLFLGG